MGETTWQGEGVVVSWYTGPAREGGLPRRRYVVTRRTQGQLAREGDAVDLSWEQWVALWRYMASRSEAPAAPEPGWSSIFLVDHAKTDRETHPYCIECFDRIPVFLRRSWVEVGTYSPTYDWENPVTCEGCGKVVVLAEGA